MSTDFTGGLGTFAATDSGRSASGTDISTLAKDPSLQGATAYPAGVTPLSTQVARRVRLAQRFLPTTDPAMANIYYNLATDPRYTDDRSYADAVARVGGFGRARQYVQYFRGIAPTDPQGQQAHANQVWDGLSGDQQKYLRAMGVTPPSDQRSIGNKGGGLLGDVMGAIWDVAGKPAAALTSGIEKGAGYALRGLALPQRAENTLYRVGAITAPGLAPFPGAKPLSSLEEGINDIQHPERVWNRFKYAVDVAGEGGGEKAVHFANHEKALAQLGGDQKLLGHALDAMVTGDPNKIAVNMANDAAQRQGFTQAEDPQRYQDVLQKAVGVLKSPKFQSAITTLAAGKVSPGRDYVAASLRPGQVEIPLPGLGKTDLHSLGSGVVDGLYTWYSDPVILGGKAIKAVRIAQSLKSVDEVRNALRPAEWKTAIDGLKASGFGDMTKAATDWRYYNGRIQKMRELGMTDQEIGMTDFVQAFAAPDEERAAHLAALAHLHADSPKFVSALVDADLKARGVGVTAPRAADAIVSDSHEIADSLDSASAAERAAAMNRVSDAQIAKQLTLPTMQGLGSPEAIRNVMTDGAGLQAVLEGRASQGVSPQIVFPKVTEASQAWRTAKIGFEEKMSQWRAAGGWNAYDAAKAEELGAPVPSAADRFKGGIAHAVAGITQQTTTRNVLEAMGPEAGTELSKFLRYSMPYDDAWNWVGKFYAAANTAGRREVVRSALDDSLTRFGLKDTGFYEDWMWATGSRAQAYAVDPRVSTIVTENGTRLPSALFESQLADNLIALPDLRQMSKALPKLAAYRDFTTGRTVMRAVDSNFIDAAMSRVWKPMTLLRIGFIPRAAGEEALAWFAREPTELAKWWAVAPFKHPANYDGEVAAPLRWIARTERRFRHFDFVDEYDELADIRRAQVDGTATAEDIQKLDALTAGKNITPEQQAIYDEFYQNKGRKYLNQGAAYKDTSIRHRNLYDFDPADVQSTLRLQRFYQQITEGLLSQHDMAQLHAMLDSEAPMRAYMQHVVGADHNVFPNYMESHNTRGELQIGRRGLGDSEPIQIVTDKTKMGVVSGNPTHLDRDPLIMQAHATAQKAGSTDPGIYKPVQEAFNGYVTPAMNRQIEGILDPAGIMRAAGTDGLGDTVVHQVRESWRHLPWDVRRDFDELHGLSATESVAGTHIAEHAANLKAVIANRLASIGEKGDEVTADVMGHYLDRFDQLPSEARSVLMNHRGAIYRSLDPTNALDAHKLDLLKRAEEGDQVAFEELLEGSVREHLVGPDGQLNMFDRSLKVGGERLAQPVAENMHRVWFPMMSETDAATVAHRLEATGDPADRALLDAWYRRTRGQVGPDHGDLVPFGYWAHSDPQVAIDTGRHLSQDQVPWTVGYTDVPKRDLGAYRRENDPQNEWRLLQPRQFDASRITAAATPDDVVRVKRPLGEEPEEHGVGPTYDEMIHEFTNERVKALKERYLDATGTPRYGLTRPVGEQNWADKYLYVDGVSIPNQTIAPERTIAKHNLWDDFTRWGYDRVITPAIDTIVRRPMYMAEAARARGQIERVVGPLLHAPTVQKIVDDATGAVSTVDIESLAKRYGFTKTVRGKEVADLDRLHEALKSTFRYAQDRDLPLNTAEDLQDVITKQRAELMTTGMHDVTIATRRMIADMRHAAGDESLLRSHPISQVLDNSQVYGPTPVGPGLAFAKERRAIAGTQKVADNEVKGLSRWFESEDDARQQITKMAGSRAFNSMTRYIVDHSVRSQYAENIRNLVPFYFAEEQFLKRWARTIAYDPSGIRKVQLLKHAMDSIGVIKRDPQSGQDYFVQPFSAELNDVLGRTSELLTGHKATLPIYVPLTGQVQYALPGLDAKGIPQVGPLVSFPLKAMANRFPELRPAENAVLGERSAALPLSSEIMPPSVSRLWDAFTASPDKSREMASTMTAVIQMMDAKGLTPGPDANAHDKEQYIERVKNWTRSMMVTRWIVGFAGPAAPSADVPGKELSVEFRNLLKTMPIGEAAATFIAQNPDATPFTVFRSKTPSGAVLPVGKSALDWMQKNQDLISAYPLGSPWLIPQKYANDPYDSRTYNEQLALGLRQRRMPGEMYDEIKFAEASPQYFDTRDNFERQIAALQGTNDSQGAAQKSQEYGRWKEAYLLQHPLFAQQLASPAAKQRRADVLDQLTQVLEDPRVATRVPSAVRYVVTAFDQYSATLDAIKYDRGAAATRERASIRVNMFNHLEAYTRQHPESRALYLRVIRPELDQTGELTSITGAAG